MWKKKKTLIGVVVVLLLLLGLLFGGYKYGLKQCKPCPPCPAPAVQKETLKPQKAVKKQTKRQVVRQEAPRPLVRTPVAPPVTQVVVPNYGTTKLILRINVVEWAPVFVGKSLMSRDIGPVIRQGLANGTVVRTREQLSFLVNGASVIVRDGSAIIDPGPIGPETVLVIQPVDGWMFASPPNGSSFFTNPGELNATVQQGMTEIWMSFILAPAKPAQSGAQKGLPPFPLFLWK